MRDMTMFDDLLNILLFLHEIIFFSRLRTDFRNRRRHIQERYQEVLRQYHSYERTQPELSVSIGK